MKAFRPDRRRFLKLSASAAGASLILGVNWSCSRDEPAEPDIEGGTFSPNAWLRIDSSGGVTVFVAESEMGQGPYTALPMLVAEELDVDWSRISIEHASLDPAYGLQVTGGSRSIRKGWKRLREAGAVAREMLLQAAANQWDVPVEECRALRGRVTHGRTGQVLEYGALSASAALLPIPESAHLKSPAEFSIIGTPIPRLDCADKINGKARFGIDIKLPGMVYATITHAPVFGEELKNLHAEAALKIDGVLDVFTIDEGVVVVARNTWSAFKGKAALQVEWEASPNRSLSNASIIEDLKSRPGDQAKLIERQGNPEALLGSDILATTYTLPFQAHAAMEPMNCTASYEAGRLRIWAPTQSPSEAFDTARTVTQSKLTRTLGRIEEKLFGERDDSIEINTTLLGGGFGRRLKQDYVSEATQIAQRIERPVQLVWTREEDLQHDFYHPLSLHEMRGKLDDKGMPAAWHHTIKGPNVKPEGAAKLPYAIPHIRVDLLDIGKILPVGPWRSVQHHYNAFAVEHFFDELARAGQHDPLELRLRLMSNIPRLRKTLEVAAEFSGWSYSSGLFGTASHMGFGSYVSEIVRLEESGGKLRIASITCVVDCGIVVNPDITKAQIEGSVIFGMSAALKPAIQFDGGRVKQHNYHDYPILNMAETPDIHVHLIESEENPGGIGEPGVPPVAPAIANALLASRGEATRELPIPYDRQGFRIA
jgi:isoquinoline 1-oxidoreductase subunit beta